MSRRSFIDSAILQQICLRFSGRLHGFFRAKRIPADDVDDLTQETFVSGRDARGCDPRKSRGSCLRSQGVLPLNTVGRGVAMHGISLRCSPSTPKAVASRILETSLPRERSLLSYSRRFHACLSASERLSRSSTWGICPAMKCHAPLGFEGSLSMTMTGKPGGVS